MNPVVKQKWVEALRSGKYQQGAGQLRHYAGGYCCLGVLCDLHSKETRVTWEELEQGVYMYNGSTGSLGPDVRSWAAVPYDLEIALVDMNDSRNCTFNEIANYLESIDE